jgi:hypothetical protein
MPVSGHELSRTNTSVSARTPVMQEMGGCEPTDSRYLLFIGQILHFAN